MFKFIVLYFVVLNKCFVSFLIKYKKETGVTKKCPR